MKRHIFALIFSVGVFVLIDAYRGTCGIVTCWILQYNN